MISKTYNYNNKITIIISILWAESPYVKRYVRYKSSENVKEVLSRVIEFKTHVGPSGGHF